MLTDGSLTGGFETSPRLTEALSTHLSQVCVNCYLTCTTATLTPTELLLEKTVLLTAPQLPVLLVEPDCLASGA